MELRKKAVLGRYNSHSYVPIKYEQSKSLLLKIICIVSATQWMTDVDDAILTYTLWVIHNDSHPYITHL